MALTCNIGAAGKAFRLKIGIATVFVGLVLGFVTAIGVLPSIAWVAVAGSLLGGAFSIFEARAGWCVVRAMGFKTAL
jgi:hypothetical protein